MPRIHVFPSAPLDKRLCPAGEVDMPGGSRIRDILEAAGLKTGRRSLLFVVNGRIEKQDYLLREGDKVRILFMAAGG